MNKKEARSLLSQIQQAQDNAWELIEQLRERNGWKVLGFDTWEACCEAEFGWSKSQVNRQLKRLKIQRQLTQAAPNGVAVPLSEGQARQLSRLPEDQRAEVYFDAREEFGDDLTAKELRSLVDKLVPPKKRKTANDEAAAEEESVEPDDEDIRDEDDLEEGSGAQDSDYDDEEDPEGDEEDDAYGDDTDEEGVEDESEYDNEDEKETNSDDAESQSAQDGVDEDADEDDEDSDDGEEDDAFDVDHCSDRLRDYIGGEFDRCPELHRPDFIRTLEAILAQLRGKAGMGLPCPASARTSRSRQPSRTERFDKANSRMAKPSRA